MQTLKSYEHACQLVGADPAAEISRDQKAELIYQAACQLLRLDPTNLPGLQLIDSDYAVSLCAIYKLQVIRKAVVGTWSADWSNYRQYKYFPWHAYDSPGFRFGGVGYGVASTCVTGGSRLCFQTEEQAEFVGRDCIALYRDASSLTEMATAR